MNLTQKEREEVTRVYDTWFNSYITGDVETYDSFFDDRYHFIGSTENEHFLDRGDTTEFFANTGDQFAGKTKIRNNTRTIEKFEGLIFVTEIFDTYFLIEGDWTYYGIFRFTSVLKKNKEGWRFIYQHFSMPDTKAEEGETIGAQKIANENLILKEAVRRRTIELEHKTRELEIESALERVRAIAMSMQKPDDLLDVCQIISEQLEALNVKNIRNVQLAIIDEERTNYANYQYFTAYSKKVFEETQYGTNPSADGMVRAMQKSVNSFFIGSIHGEELKNFIEWRNKNDQFPDPLLDKSDAVYYYFYSIGKGGLGLTTYKEISKESLEIFKRFHKVFTLAYQRFNDIRQALAQAREAQIEAALERVRARAMAMHKADELVEVTLLLRKEMGHLGVEELETSSIYILNETIGKTECWFSIQDRNDENKLISDHMILDLNDTWVGRQMQEFYHSKNLATSIVMKGEERIEWITYCAEKSDLFSAEGFYGKTIPERTYHLYKFKNGYMGAAAPGDISTESWDLLKRATAVFSLAYTRFSDLKKAEAQAREAQIEAALERVRSKAMAMHNSENLLDAISEFFVQLKWLNIVPVRCGVAQMFDDPPSWIAAATNSTMQGESVHLSGKVDALDHEVLQGIYDHWIRQENYFPVLLGDDIKAYYKVLRPQIDIPAFPEGEVHHGHYFNFKEGNIFAWTKEPLSEDEKSIFIRFSSVLSLTYRRYLDIKESEKQAREAQIEIALERVRARSLSMHSSDELSGVASVLFEQMRILGGDLFAFGIVLCDKEKNEVEQWHSIGEEGMMSPFQIPVDLDYIHQYRYNQWKAGTALFSIEIPEDYIEKHFELMFTVPSFKDSMKEVAEKGININTPSWEIDYGASFSHGYLLVSSLSPFKEDYIFPRFAKVFEQAYTRFLDLQKAEAQAREAQIESALEKVRSRSMAMQNSNELADLSYELVKQVHALGIDTWFCAFNIYDDDPGGSLEWGSNMQGTYEEYRTPREGIFLNYYQAGQSGETLLINEIGKDECSGHYEYLCSLPGVGEQLLQMKDAGIQFPTSQIDHVAYFKYGYIIFITFEPVPTAHDIFKRFAKVFEQTYTRFLDLKNAEAQAREAQIETALERVRSRSMGMQKSDELNEVIHVIYDQFDRLGIKVDHTGFIVDYKKRDDMLIWLADQNGPFTKIAIPWFDSPHWNSYVEAKKKGKDFFANQLDFETKNKFYKKLFKFIPGLPDESKKFYFECPGLAISTVLLDNVGLYIENFSGTPYSEEENNVLMRFGKVFQQSYTRFLDLEKAESQARESMIELSLERIRAQVTAMQESDELLDIVVTMQAEFNKLGHEAHYFWHMRWLPDKYEKALTNGDGTRIGNVLELPRDFHGLKNMMDWEQSDEPTAVFALEPDVAADYINKMIKLGRFQEIDHSAPGPDEVRDMGGLTFVMARTTHGEIGYTLPGVVPNPPKEDIALLARFAGVFDLAYRRFEDLKSAERQNRETQIDLALERVRSKAMAMHSSEDLGKTVDTFFAELKGLNVSPHRCGVGIVDKKTRIAKVQAIDTNPEQQTRKIIGDLKLAGHPVLDNIFKHWKSQKEYFPVLKGNEIADYYKVMDPQVKFHDFADDEIQYGYYFYFNEGGVYAWTDRELSEQDLQIFRKYTSVLSLTYRRYLDLKDAEAKTREAVKQSSLDRIRGQIASMRSANDLEQITPLIWNELKSLEVPFFRCGVFIVNEKQHHVQVYLTTPEGKSLAALDLDYNMSELTKNTVESWRKGKAYKTHWNREEFVDWTQEMMKLRQIETPEEYQGKDKPPESLHLHFIPFTQGMLYVGNGEALEDEKIDLVKSLAEAFSFAYSRYEDFVVLEEAKARVEKALSDLKATQSQLVHAEKMASLGELTAGIAHEIQNPLNFVNNFSEVSTDLIEELKEELKNGDTEEVNAIATDLLHNLEKINHHGKRASNIVKSMLEHSRAGSGKKEPTDLNALADEYLRLAYHGLRAKDKSFHAGFKLEADPNLPEVNVIPQDIGRVLLNLINNAFFAVAEKSKQNIEGYKPQVFISTSYSPLESLSRQSGRGRGVSIRVSDNGPGIPAEIKEKIFQPFFTTKPTGQGTGLGLSMSYDIITKGHGGELKVESIEGEGTEFIILLNTKS